MASRIAERVAPLFAETFRDRSSAVTDKSDGDQQGTLDLRSHEIFTEEIARAYPGVDIISEEDAEKRWPPTAEATWLLDPFDGTDNFLAGALLVGAMETFILHGKVEASFILLPFEYALTGRGIYSAVRGQGAFAAERSRVPRKMRVTNTTTLAEAFALLEGSSKKLATIAAANRLQGVARRCRAVLGAGLSAVLVADGGANPRGVSVLAAFRNKPWDNLPAPILVEEAGGRATDHAGNPITITNYKDMVASNGLVHDEVLDVINHRRSEG